MLRGTEAASRTDRGDGTTGANVGTKQASAFLRHNHTASVTDPGHVHPYIRPELLVSNVHPTGCGRNDPGTFATDNTTSTTTGISVTVANTAANDSTSETRPKLPGAAGGGTPRWNGSHGIAEDAAHGWHPSPRQYRRHRFNAFGHGNLHL